MDSLSAYNKPSPHLAFPTNAHPTEDQSSQPQSHASSSKTGESTIASPPSHTHIPIAAQRLLLRPLNDLSQTIPAPMVICTPLPCNVQYFSTETHPTLTPNYPLPNAFLVDLLKTLYRSFLVATNPSLPGGKPSLLEKKH